MRKINKVKLFVNDNLKSRNVAEIVISKSKDKHFEIVDEEFDLGIAIGGDGSFLRMVKESNFNSDIYYVGINAGTLGFAQDVSIDEIDEFVNLLSMDSFKIEKVGVQEIEITTDDSISRHFSLNEFVVLAMTITLMIMSRFKTALCEKLSFGASLKYIGSRAFGQLLNTHFSLYLGNKDDFVTDSLNIAQEAIHSNMVNASNTSLFIDVVCAVTDEEYFKELLAIDSGVIGTIDRFKDYQF